MSARRVFLSRTSEFSGLPTSRPYVDAAKQACNDAEFLHSDMTDWSASSRVPAEECRRRVLACDAYVGIIGFSYGSAVRDEPHLSYTELEYETARRAGRPRLLFLLPEDDSGADALSAPDGQHQRSFPGGAVPGQHRGLLQPARGVAPPGGRGAARPAAGTGGDDAGRAGQRTLREATARVPGALRAAVAGLRAARAPRSRPASACRRRELDSDGGPPVVALHGPGGFDKSILAAEACRQMRSEFPDGVMWAALGPEPSQQGLAEQCQQLVLALTGEYRPLEDTRAAGEHLAQVLEPRRALLVLDDVWQVRDLEPFLHGAPGVVRLITTRVHSALPDATASMAVEPLTDEQAMSLLRRDLPDAGVDWTPLLGVTGRWPLLVRLVNAALRQDVEAGSDCAAAAEALARALSAKVPSWLDPRYEAARARAVAATVEASLNRLDARTTDLFRDLALLAESDVPLRVLEVWRDLDEHESTLLARELHDLSLVASYDVGAGTVRLHQVLRQYLLSTQPEDALRARHASFVAAHRPSSGRWAELPEDPAYVWRRVALHLRHGDRLDELDATVRDVAFLEEPVELGRHEGGTLTVGWHPDHSVLASGGCDGDVRSWRLDGDGGRLELPSPAARTAEVAWAPDGRTLATTGNDGAVRLWSARADEPPAELGRHARHAGALCWLAGGEQVASGSDDGVVRVWTVDQMTAGSVLELTAPGGCVRALAASPSAAELAVVGGDGSLLVWRLDTPAAPVRLPRRGGATRSVHWSPDGLVLLTGDDDGALRLWPTDVWDSARELGRHGSALRAVAWSPDGREVVAGDDGGSLTIWDLGSGRHTDVGRHDGGVHGVAWSDDGTGLLSVGCDGLVRVWRRRAGRRPFTSVQTVALAGVINTGSWQPHGRRVAVAGSYGVYVLDVRRPAGAAS